MITLQPTMAQKTQFTGAAPTASTMTQATSFEGKALQKDTVSFGAGTEAAKGVITKVLEFVKSRGSAIVELLKNVVKGLIGLPAKVLGMLKGAKPPVA